MFENLKGIEKEREIKPRKRTTFLKIRDLCDMLISKYSIIENHAGNWSWWMAWKGVHEDAKKELEYIDFNQKHIKDFIFSNEHLQDGKAKYITGVYSGVLLSELTKRNKRTRFHIDGQGMQFDWLFAHAYNIDELVVDNFKGGSICSDIAYEGKANTAICRNIEGGATFHNAGHRGKGINVLAGINLTGDRIMHDSYAKIMLAKKIKGDSTLDRAGIGSHKIRLITAIDIEGNGALGDIAQDEDGINELNGAEVGIIIAKNIKGDNILMNTGQPVEYEKGVEVIYAENIKGNNLLADAAKYRSRTKYILAKNIQGNQALHEVGGYHSEASRWSGMLRFSRMVHGGRIDNIIALDITGDNILEKAGKDGKIERILYDNIQGKDILKDAKAKKIAEGNHARRQFERVAKRYEINEITELVESLGDQKPDELVKLVKKIQSKYKEVEPLLKNV